MTDYSLAAISAAALPLPEGRRPPFEWHVVPIGGMGAPPAPRWPDGVPAGPAMLRITIGIQFREFRRVAVIGRSSQALLGQFDLRFVPTQQTHEIPLATIDPAGVELRLIEGGEPIWIFDGRSDGA